MKYLHLLFALLLTQSIFAQTTLPVIKATSKKVAINDGGILDKNAWSLSPGARPDVYTAERSHKTKWVTFYTDLDSIKVKVKPGTRFNFVILLNGKDSCFTQIASAIPPEDPLKRNVVSNDTIPFTLTGANAIHVKAVINDTDTLNMHFDISSFDFHITKNAILKKTKLLANQPDAIAGKAEPNYNKLAKVFKLQVGNMIWNDPPVSATNLTADDMDGRIGWTVFNDKIVELDYDKSLMIIHSQLPKGLKGYTKAKLGFTRYDPYIKATFEIAGKQYTGGFIMDNGSAEAVILNGEWAAKQNFPTNLKVIKTASIRDADGHKYETNTVIAPVLKLNGFTLTNIPTVVLSSKIRVENTLNFFGNDALKRFNMILDLKNDYIYLKPNKLFEVKYKGDS
ncbi:MAG: hypothetical protein JWR09_2424 [Mucilaginibacter sp.]|nr:hypothetical protein [Mucilaginibacter sp.]